MNNGCTSAISDDAYVDLEEAVIYYNAERVGIGYEFEQEFYGALEALSTFHAYEIKYDNMRIYYMPRFAHWFPYVVNNVEQEILIEAIERKLSNYQNRKRTKWKCQKNGHPNEGSNSFPNIFCFLAHHPYICTPFDETYSFPNLWLPIQ